LDPQNFILIINDEEKDFTKPIDITELQTCVFKIIPIADSMSIKLFKNHEKIDLYRLETSDPSKHYFSSIMGIEFKEIGISDLEVIINGHSFKQKIRARPTKITLDEYKKILEDIRNETYNLAFSIFGQSSEEVKLAKTVGQKSIIEFLSYFRKNFEVFTKVFARIEKDPNQNLTAKRRISEIFETEIFDDIVEFEACGKMVFPIEQELGFLPRRVSFLESTLSYDIYENRLLKHFLGSIINTLSYIESTVLAELRLNEDRLFLQDSEKLNNILEECRLYKKATSNMLNKNFLKEVSSIGIIKTSMVLQREPKYRSFYNLYQESRKNSLLEIDSEYFHIPIRRAWQIYEIWAFLQVARVLQKIGFQPLPKLFDSFDQTSFNVRKVGFNFGLKENTPLLEFENSGIRGRLFYQRFYPIICSNDCSEFGSVIPFEKKPDIVIEFKKEAQNVPDLIILDAKYRLESSLDNALKDMSHYSQIICDGTGKKIVRSAHIIYPGLETQTFPSNTGYIGLLPFGDYTVFDRTILDLLTKVVPIKKEVGVIEN
jgi:uncharacterized protein